MRNPWTIALALTAMLPASFAACLPSRPPAPVAGPVGPSAVAGSPSGSEAGPDLRGPKSDHPDALGRLLAAPWGGRTDKRRVLSLALPDAAQWTHVRYHGVTTLAGFRYGPDHHVALAVFAFEPKSKPATLAGCVEKFQAWGEKRAKQFDIVVGDARVESVAWPPGAPKAGGAKVFVLDAERRSIFGNKRYAAAYAIYQAWDDACLGVGLAVPEEGAEVAARAVRDKLVRDTLPTLTVRPGAGALALEAKSDVD